jgi:hypothetical protein
MRGAGRVLRGRGAAHVQRGPGGTHTHTHTQRNSCTQMLEVASSAGPGRKSWGWLPINGAAAPAGKANGRAAGAPLRPGRAGSNRRPARLPAAARLLPFVGQVWAELPRPAALGVGHDQRHILLRPAPARRRAGGRRGRSAAPRRRALVVGQAAGCHRPPLHGSGTPERVPGRHTALQQGQAGASPQSRGGSTSG